MIRGDQMSLQSAIEKLSPLSEHSLYVLLSLFKGENHGYGVVIETRDLTEGKLELKPATAYKAINRFIEYGLVLYSEEFEGKKYYKITDDGKEFLKNEFLRIELLNSNLIKIMRSDINVISK